MQRNHMGRTLLPFHGCGNTPLEGRTGVQLATRREALSTEDSGAPPQICRDAKLCLGCRALLRARRNRSRVVTKLAGTNRGSVS